MKKALTFFVACVCLLLLFSCRSDPGGSSQGNEDGRICITFVVDGKKEEKIFSKNEKIVYPTVAEKENYVFRGWFYDKELNVPAYLGTSFSSDVTLYAGYSFDAASALNKIYSNQIKASVEVLVEHKKNLFSQVSTQKVTGSGVIFDEDESCYYVLTNAHVIVEKDGYSRTVSVTDCYGAKHSAVVIKALDEYDLALLKIAKTEKALYVIRFAEEAAKLGDTVISVGSPGGIDNAVTVGEIKKYDVTPESIREGKLSFAVIWHDSKIDHGSSGGMLLNAQLELVGINYAVGTSTDDSEFVCGFAVDAEKINEFLEK